MTYLDKKALDVAVETLRPLFREPVSYLEQAARDCIAAYFTAAPPAPVGEVGELVERLRERAGFAREENTATAICDARHFEEAADALNSLAARLAECERERDEARNVGIAIGQSQGFKLLLRLQDRVEALEKALIYIRDSGLLSPLGTAFKTVCAALPNKGEG
jgi:hypothetical protein